ncbi:MAG: class I SAM-dependent methyltransferase [Firmicutes bacterium]|nr:class I SAM-dependent methyltransferase [Bacillota bacterium]
MALINPSKRIRKMATHINEIGSLIHSVADIGTDHGYLPFLLHETGTVKRSILCDINKGPLENAKKTFEHLSLKADCEFRLGSGMVPLKPAEVDLVVIAGMGGGLIRDILSYDLSKTKRFKYFLLQPMTEQDRLREWLEEQGLEIVWDLFFTDLNKHYELILVTTLKDIPELNTLYEDKLLLFNGDMEFGRKIRRDNLVEYKAFLAHKARKYTLIREAISGEANLLDNDKLTLCNTKLAQLQTILTSLSKEV